MKMYHLLKHNTINVYKGVAVQFHMFSTLGLNGGE